MRLLLAALFLLAAAVARADEPKRNTLTPKEVAEGWLLLFDGETTFGWRVEGEATVKDGKLVLGCKKETRVMTTTEFAACGMAMEYTVEGDKAPKIFLAVKDIPLPVGNGWITGTLNIDSRGEGGGIFRMARHLELSKTASGDRPEAHRSAIGLHIPAGTTLSVRNFKLRPEREVGVGLSPIFNGKDLTGWKKYATDEKRAKTEFSVTEDGWLHLKNGPGDLQTEGLYDDFVLQVECRTNGKNLNSGVFFRCIPGEYQNGYEAQVHNGFDPDKLKEYTVEEYDPKTNELKDTKKVKSAALDYGTGAIYRRGPARRQAAKDNEWFTMTVVAQGRHVATWVNGVQVVDWTDNRPLKDNPRNGCRLEKGCISLQGHDPTTDIDVRSIRLAKLPKAAN